MANKTGIRTLKIQGFAKVPQKDIVKSVIENAFRSFRDVLTIDFTGTAKNPTYTFSFVNTYKWSPLEKIGHRYWCFAMGMSYEVNTEVLSKVNYCEDSSDPTTCTLVYPRQQNLLGKVIGNTAVHEIVHMFGFNDKHAFKGASKDGHTGDPSNFMFDIPLHNEYKLLRHMKTKKYVIKKGETLSSIARKMGLMSGTRLAMLKGKDGLTNKQILTKAIMGRGGIGLGAVQGVIETNNSFAGLSIWVPDIDKWIQFRRNVESQPKTFYKDQMLNIRKHIVQGKEMMSIN
jgi:hypothetical protein